MSDDDWDAIDEEELDKRVAQQKKKNDSESEEEDKPAWQVEQQARPKAKPKPKVKAEFYVPLEDATEEKKRRQKAVEDADLRLAEDLFSGIDKPEGQEEDDKHQAAAAEAAAAKPKAKKVEVKTVVVDAFDKVTLKTQADVESLSAQCLEKINGGKAKTAGPKFLTDLFKAMEGDMDLKDLQAVDKVLTDIVKLKKTEKAEANTKVAKAQTITKTSGVNVHDELSTVYGGGGEWDEWDDEDWAEWEAQEAKKAAAKAAAKPKAKPKAKGKAGGPSDLAQDFPTL